MDTENEERKTRIEWNIKTVVLLIVMIIIPLLVGGISSFMTKDAMSAFDSMNKPPLAPPGWLFPIAWTILYVLMGIASFCIIKSDSKCRIKGIIIYIIQLITNFFWSIIFFDVKAYTFAAIWLGALLIMIIALIINTAKYSKAACFML